MNKIEFYEIVREAMGMVLTEAEIAETSAEVRAHDPQLADLVEAQARAANATAKRAAELMQS